MREIRFRVWDKKEKKWIHGPGYEVNLFGEMILMGELLKGLPLERHEDVEALQYTGLKDKNGKEIYEGDIDSRGLVVEYLVGMSGYYLMKNGDGFHLSHDQAVLNNRIKHIEIVGNIYENSDLLETK